METSKLLRQAIQKARDGHELTARDMFLDIVQLDPENEVAWMWLSGLLDPLEDRITACERVLSINPNNRQTKIYLDGLLRERNDLLAQRTKELEVDYRKARELVKKGMQEDALVLTKHILREWSDQHEGVWLLYASLVADPEDKIQAYKRALEINPSNRDTLGQLGRLKHFRDHPLDLAAFYEEEGNLDKALIVYQKIAAQSDDPKEVERIHKEIVHIEDLQVDRIRHVPTSVTIARLAIGFPLLYVLLVLLQEGLNPLLHPAFHLWVGIPWCFLGSFLIALANVRSRHILWRKLFRDEGSGGSKAARRVVSIVGFLLVLLPFTVLVFDSIYRLNLFIIPSLP